MLKNDINDFKMKTFTLNMLQQFNTKFNDFMHFFNFSIKRKDDMNLNFIDIALGKIFF